MKDPKSSAIRIYEQLKKYITPFQQNYNVKLPCEDRMIKVFLIPTDWYRSLEKYCSPEKKSQPPSKIKISSLLDGNEYKEDLKLGKDYLIIQSDISGEFKRLFDFDVKPIVVPYVLHPDTKKPFVVLRPKIFIVSYKTPTGEIKNIRKHVDSSWIISDVIKQLCKALKFDVSQGKFCFYNKTTCEEIPSDITCEELMLKNCENVYLGNKPPSNQRSKKTSKQNPQLPNLAPIKTNSIPSKNSNVFRGDFLGLDCNRGEVSTNTTLMINSSNDKKIDVSSKSMSSTSSSLDQPIPYFSSEKSQDLYNDINLSQPVSKIHQNLIPKNVGFMNLGNTCYFNAATQCLIKVRPLTEFILSDEFEKQLNIKNPNGSKGQIAKAYRNLLKEVCNSNSSISPSQFRSSIVQKFRRFGSFAQHDSHELLFSIIDGLHEDFNHPSSNPPTPDEDSLASYNRLNESPIKNIFCGNLLTTITCPECKFKEESRDPFITLSLPLVKGSSNVKDCIEIFEKEQDLDSKNCWKCSKCNKMVRAKKATRIEKCGSVLIIQLSRFNRFMNNFSKNDQGIKYTERLNLNSQSFHLIGVVFHMGTLEFGHYTAAGFDYSKKGWFYFNDSSVQEIRTSEIIQPKAAYILIYEKE